MLAMEARASFSAGSLSLGAGGALALASGDGRTSGGLITVSVGKGANAVGVGGSVAIDSGVGTPTSSGSICLSSSGAGDRA